jgi:quercetin dioxygenase-like cupin family protein
MKILRVEDLKAPSDDAAQFQGFEHGAEVSFFVAETLPGGGPDRHRHPYEETFVVLRGEIEFVADDETRMVSGGSIVIVPAGTWHEFRNRSDVPALLVNVHPVAKMVTEWAEGN